MSTAAPASPVRGRPAEPARARGLRRTRGTAPYPPTPATPLPAPVDAVHLLALLTRVRAKRVTRGELTARRLHDVRAFKCCYAELGYLRRLAAAGATGGTVLTSMPQLVAGLAAMHPAWNLDGDHYAARDRHHRAVRRRLCDLQAMGLLRWQIGADLDGEERRTELELRPAPAATPDELAAAARILALWQRRYGAALNTGSRTGIRNAAGHGRPLSAAERARCGRERVRARSRRGAHLTNTTPPCGASPTAQNTPPPEPPKPPSAICVCPRTGVTRATAPSTATDPPAITPHPHPRTTGNEEEGPAVKAAVNSINQPAGPSGSPENVPWNPEQLIARVRARETERAPLIAVIAQAAQARANETAGWTLKRAWPAARLREAWVVARFGAHAAADAGAAAAGPLAGEDYARLRRAVARYERSAAAAPEGYPAGGVAALLHIGTLAAAGELNDPPRLLAYAIGRLDQLSRRMRAIASANSATRHQTAAERARRRHTARASAERRFSYRRSQWPAWILTDGHAEPRFDRHGRLVLEPARAMLAPAPNTEHYRTVMRDAHLLAGHRLPAEFDGRQQMAAHGLHGRGLAPTPPAVEELELRELAHRTGEAIAQLRRIAPAYRQAWLARQRHADAAQARTDTLALRAQIAALTRPSRPA